VSPSVQEAYRVCRGIARKEAKNFYYAFVALPRAKRDAICAVYAFMRHADDLSDDESAPIAARCKDLAQWLEAWHRTSAGEATKDPVFIAMADAQKRFGIASQLLDQLVQGTAMDLERVRGRSHDAEVTSERARYHKGSEARYDTYDSFEDLYRYCYLVASVVGLVSIRIFGYSDSRAEKLAEETGIAFQLTNILRDVREDLERGRLYLPLSDLKSHGVSIIDLEAVAANKASLAPNERELLKVEGDRAAGYYKSGYELLPLISPDARPALRVLIEIYHGLLKRIARENYDVFSRRIAMPAPMKLWLLLRGLASVMFYRLRAGK
jgi:phytoene synthase